MVISKNLDHYPSFLYIASVLNFIRLKMALGSNNFNLYFVCFEKLHFVVINKRTGICICHVSLVDLCSVLRSMIKFRV